MHKLFPPIKIIKLSHYLDTQQCKYRNQDGTANNFKNEQNEGGIYFRALHDTGAWLRSL